MGAAEHRTRRAVPAAASRRIERDHTEKSPLAAWRAKIGVMRAFFFLAAIAVALAACLDDPVETVGSHSAAVGPAPDWTVTSGNEACDGQLRSECPRAAVACLGDSECKALFTCVRDCGKQTSQGHHDGDHDDDGDCTTKCGRAHRPPWRLYDPFNECANSIDACR